MTSDFVGGGYNISFAGFHSIPIHEDKSPFQTKEQLGTLRSGGCVRQDFDDAVWTFGWTDVGTRVIMTP